MPDELAYWLALDSIKNIGLGKKRIINLFNYFGDIKLLWESSLSELSSINQKNNYKIPQSTLESFVQIRNSINLNSQVENISKKNIKAFPINSEFYPEECRELSDPPLIIYCKGHWNINFFKKSIAIVGSREASEFFENIASDFSYKLASLGFTIITGVARGIDVAAHRGCMSVENSISIAVVANGVDQIVPTSSKLIYEFLEKNGCIISEYPPETLPEKGFFPARNRIIAALSNSVLVVQAGQKSGALITAQDALNLNKKVFCIASSLDNKLNEGCNLWIRKKKATLVTSCQDILEELNLNSSNLNNLKFSFEFDNSEFQANLKKQEEQAQKTQQIKLNNLNLEKLDKLDKEELEIYKIIEACPEKKARFDDLIEKSNFPANKINSLLLKLKLKKLVRTQGSDIFIN